ncbi:MAG: DUF3347 domain-containing protein [Cyclobacteriaceae bacterium]
MKKQILTVVALFVALGTTYAQHNHGTNDKKEGSKMDHSMHQGMKMDKKGAITYEVSTDFKNQLTEVYNASLKLADSFVAGEVEGVSNSSQQVKTVLGEVDMSLLKSSEAHMDWMMNLKVMNTSLDDMAGSKDIKDQKAAYDSFNQSLFKSIKAFGIAEGSVYYQYCPMALDSQGAYWLSDTKEIRNPYFGGNMLSCGSTKETVN